MTDAEIKREVYLETLRWLRAERRRRERDEHDERTAESLRRLGYPIPARQRGRR